MIKARDENGEFFIDSVGNIIDGAQPTVECDYITPEDLAEAEYESMHNTGAQPMVEEYDACWMMMTDEGTVHYIIWVAVGPDTVGMTMEEEDKLYVRELELVSLGGC